MVRYSNTFIPGLLLLLSLSGCGGGNTDVSGSGNGGNPGAGPTAGQAVLTWVAPVTNTDNSTLTDLAGFKISWGPSVGNYPNSITIYDPSATTRTISNLPSGDHVFVVQALDTSGNLSGFSASLTKQVP